MEEGGHRILLTGDGHASDILEGLEARGKMDAHGEIHLSVLKVQHHGSEHNLDEEFCRRVTADHYVFCGNGAHENPDLQVIEAIVNSRLDPAKRGQQAEASQPFRMWFNSSPRVDELKEKRRQHMEEVEELTAELVAGSHGKLRTEYLTAGEHLLKVGA